jgi:hypothetical protein
VRLGAEAPSGSAGVRRPCESQDKGAVILSPGDHHSHSKLLTRSAATHHLARLIAREIVHQLVTQHART